MYIQEITLQKLLPVEMKTLEKIEIRQKAMQIHNYTVHIYLSTERL